MNGEKYETKIVSIDSIKISEDFARTVPNETKLRECRDYYDTFGEQVKDIILNDDGLLVDGYAMYLVLKENGVRKAQVKIDNSYRNKITTYVYGIHLNSSCNKEYLWRIPSSLKTLEENIKIGDVVIAKTKHGYAPIFVTKVETLRKCPCKRAVKCVVRKVED